MDNYTKKLETENQELNKRIIEVEEENRKLIEEITKLDPTFLESQFKNIDLTQEVEQAVLKDIDKEVHDNFLREVHNFNKIQKQWEKLQVEKKLIDPNIPPIIK